MGTCQWEFGRRTMGCANSSGIERRISGTISWYFVSFSDLVITGMKGTKKKQLAEQLADYVEAVSHQPYQSPSQLKNHTRLYLSIQWAVC